MNWLLIPILAVTGGVADRLRGTYGSPASVAYAILLAFATVGLYPESLVLLLAYAVAYWAGELSGWGYPLGSALRGYRDPRRDDHRGKSPHGWQRGILRRDNHAALLVRGAMWGLPVLIVSGVAHYWIGADVIWWAVPVMAITMLASALIAAVYAKARTLNEQDRMRRSQVGWPVAEVLRGALTVPALYVLGGVL
jgi:hypothetical protein